MKPSIGRIVHFWDARAKEPLPAMIGKVHSDTCVSLTVFDPFRPEGFFNATSVGSKETMAGGRYWVWPPRVEDDRAPAHWNAPAGDEQVAS